MLNWVTVWARGVHVSLVRGPPPTALPGRSHDAAQARQGRNGESHVRKESSDRHAVSHGLSAVAGRFTGVILQVLPTACRDGGHHPTLQMRGLRPAGLVSPAQVTQVVEAGFGPVGPEPSSVRLWECPPRTGPGAARTSSPPLAGWTGPPSLSARSPPGAGPAAAFLLPLQHTGPRAEGPDRVGLLPGAWEPGWGGMGRGSGDASRQAWNPSHHIRPFQPSQAGTVGLGVREEGQPHPVRVRSTCPRDLPLPPP